MKKIEEMVVIYDDLYVNDHLLDQVASHTDEEPIRSIWFHTIVYKDEMKCIPDYLAEAPFQALELDLGYNLRWHFYEERILSLADLHCRLEDLMQQNEDITENELEHFWNSIPAKAGNYDRVSFEEKTVILAASLTNKPIKEAYFPSAVSVVRVLQESGVERFGELPSTLSVLAGKDGLERSDLALFFKDLMNLHTKELSVGPLRVLSPERYFHPFYREYEEWITGEMETEESGEIMREYLDLLVTDYLASRAADCGERSEREQDVLKERDRQLGERFTDVLDAFELAHHHQRAVTESEVDLRTLPGFIFGRLLRTRGYRLFVDRDQTYATKLDPQVVENAGQSIVERFRELFHLKAFTLDELTHYCGIQAVEKQLPFGYVYSFLTSQMKPVAESAEGDTALSRQDIVEMVIREYTDGVAVSGHHDEICEKVNTRLPEGMEKVYDLSDDVFTGYLEKRLLLWGPDTYIHEQNVSVDREFIKEAEQHAEMIMDDEEHVSLAEMYSHFKETAAKQNIPTVEAFYSVMVKYLDEDFVYPIYPVMHSRGSYCVDLLLEELQWV